MRGALSLFLPLSLPHISPVVVCVCLVSVPAEKNTRQTRCSVCVSSAKTQTKTQPAQSL